MSDKYIEKLVILSRRVKDSIDSEGVANGKCYFDIQYLLGYISALEIDHPIKEPVIYQVPTVRIRTVPPSKDHVEEIPPTRKKRKYTPRKSHPWNHGGEASERVQKIESDTETKIGTKPWSQKHVACIICNTTERKHMGGGRCTRCYFLKDHQIVDNKQEDAPEEKRTMAVPKDTAFCQNAQCPKGKILRRKAEMYRVDDMVFCNKECSEEVLGKGEEVKE